MCGCYQVTGVRNREKADEALLGVSTSYLWLPDSKWQGAEDCEHQLVHSCTEE